MWRPKEWKFSIEGQVHSNPRSIYEAGADAMLEALKFKLGKYVADYEIPWASDGGHYSGVQQRDGWLIFIPNEESK